MHADQGTAVKHVGPSEKKSEESESFIYIRDILFILADKLGSLRAPTSNGLWLFPPARGPLIPTRHCFSPITSCLDADVTAGVKLVGDFFVEMITACPATAHLSLAFIIIT